jgi:hypothetical protein
MLPDADELAHDRPATAPAAGELLPGSSGVALADDARLSGEEIVPRRPRWPLGLAALVAVGAAVVVIAVRGKSAPVAAGSAEVRADRPAGSDGARPSAPAVPEPPAPPPSAAAVVSPAAAPDPAAPAPPPSATTTASPGATTAASPPAAPAEIMAELAVEPRGAQLSVDDQPVTLVGGRARLALSPGDHEAVASAGGRVARQRFTVTPERAARITLRVPAASPAAAPSAAAQPRTAPHVDVDGVEDPFRK